MERFYVEDLIPLEKGVKSVGICGFAEEATRERGDHYYKTPHNSRHLQCRFKGTGTESGISAGSKTPARDRGHGVKNRH